MESITLGKTIKDKDFPDFSKYHTVFCDSSQALEWAYKNGLPQSAIIKTSSPSLLWNKNKNIKNIEKRWTTEEIALFQNEIKKLNETIFDKASGVDGVGRELAMIISQSAYRFQKIVYKAACLNDNDFNNHRLFIYVEGKSGPAGNIMNSPWDQLLSSNNSFLKVDYTLKNDKWKMLTTRGVSFFRRYKIAGYQTLIYRLAIKLMKNLPNGLFKREVIMPNENELNIEIAYSLIMSGVKGKSGRKSTADKRQLIEALNNDIEIRDVVLKLRALIMEKNITAIRVYLEMMFGKPSQMMEVSAPPEMPLFNIEFKKFPIDEE